MVVILGFQKETHLGTNFTILFPRPSIPDAAHSSRKEKATTLWSTLTSGAVALQRQPSRPSPERASTSITRNQLLSEYDQGSEPHPQGGVWPRERATFLLLGRPMVVDLSEERGLRGQLKSEGGQPELSLTPAQGVLARARKKRREQTAMGSTLLRAARLLSK